jgi:hypothetical protein
MGYPLDKPPGAFDVSELDAARRQLRTAIELFFEDRDPVSVHTLIHAAKGIIDGRCKAKGVKAGREALLDTTSPEKRERVMKIIDRLAAGRTRRG